MYETYNYLNSFLKTEGDLKNLKESYKKILICFSVIIPHFSNECLEDLDMNNNINWPQYDKKTLEIVKASCFRSFS